jgi:DNA replication and repair protein RecF
MYIRQLSLTNFRNYTRLELVLPERVVLLHGANAQGKTNLLEAIYYLATSRSPQATTDRELINWIADQEEMVPYARLMTEVMRGDRSRQIEIVLQKEPVGGGTDTERSRLRKQILVDKAKRRGIDLVGQLNVVFFMPQDMALVDGSPSGRRRYLDVALCQVEPEYCRALSRYNRVLAERNALLRQWHERHTDPDELVYWNKQMIGYGVTVMLGRRNAVGELNRRAADLHERLSGGVERLELVYEPTVSVDAADGVESLTDTYRDELTRIRRREIERGMTLIGPHRDELLFVVNGRVDLGRFGSRGQQRTAVIALKLAEVDWMRQRTGEWPILLLDEVLAELDAQRREFLLTQVNGVEQALITTTDPAFFDDVRLADMTLLKVEGGRVFEQDRSTAEDLDAEKPGNSDA